MRRIEPQYTRNTPHPYTSRRECPIHPLIQTALKLVVQFTQRPVLVGGFDFVKTAFVRFFDAQHKNVVGPTEGEGAFRLSRRCLDDWQALPVSQQGKQCIPIRGPLVALLLVLSRISANTPHVLSRIV